MTNNQLKPPPTILIDKSYFILEDPQENPSEIDIDKAVKEIESKLKKMRQDIIRDNRYNMNMEQIDQELQEALKKLLKEYLPGESTNNENEGQEEILYEPEMGGSVSDSNELEGLGEGENVEESNGNSGGEAQESEDESKGEFDEATGTGGNVAGNIDLGSAESITVRRTQNPEGQGFFSPNWP